MFTYILWLVICWLWQIKYQACFFSFTVLKYYMWSITLYISIGLDCKIQERYYCTCNWFYFVLIQCVHTFHDIYTHSIQCNVLFYHAFFSINVRIEQTFIFCLHHLHIGFNPFFYKGSLVVSSIAIINPLSPRSVQHFQPSISLCLY